MNETAMTCLYGAEFCDESRNEPHGGIRYGSVDFNPWSMDGALRIKRGTKLRARATACSIAQVLTRDWCRYPLCNQGDVPLDRIVTKFLLTLLHDTCFGDRARLIR